MLRAKGPTPTLAIAAMVAAGLLALTLIVAYVGSDAGGDRGFSREAVRSVEAVPETTNRCAIFQARFGGSRADLVKVMRGSVANYVVLEVGKRDPLLRRQRSVWLRGAYGDGEQTWIGSFSSPDAAMTRAVGLCPAQLRCWPGDAACGSSEDIATPARIFLNL
jgi:hypothetical protein